MQELRDACAAVAARARHVSIDEQAISGYAASLAGDGVHFRIAEQSEIDPPPGPEEREKRAAFWLTLDAINFGSGWFPELRKRDGLSGYYTIASAWRERAPMTATEAATVAPGAVATMLGQDPGHELMALYAASLNDLGAHVMDEYAGSFGTLACSTGGSAVALARRLGGWPCFADTSRYEEIAVSFLKRAQIAAADLARAGVASVSDLAELTMFADNLVPHVLRLDGVLTFAPKLVDRIDREELIEHGSLEEVEIRACAVHAVERIVAAIGDDARDSRPGVTGQRSRPVLTAAAVDEILWNRGQRPVCKASPRHRCRCTAY